tara:strand:+ start:252 stop:371 length:120 start_codon:yes stop_codon:yes gene_type:complete
MVFSLKISAIKGVKVFPICSSVLNPSASAGLMSKDLKMF